MQNIVEIKSVLYNCIEVVNPMVKRVKQSGSPTVIDLFCGCGGFSLGFERAGFRVVAALDSDPHAIHTYKRNRPEMAEQAIIQGDLTQLSPESLADRIGVKHVDVILGGPPCQGFSSVRQVDGSNSGERMVHDPRRDLYQDYFRYISFFQPTFFVMENVIGLKTMNKGQWWTNIRREARQLGYRICPTEFMASNYGVPQNRRRLLIVGTRENHSLLFNRSCLIATHIENKRTLAEAIGDLPDLKAGEGVSPTTYDMNRRLMHVEKYGKDYLYDVLEVDNTKMLTGHIARPHSDRDLRDFARLNEGENSSVAMRRGVKFEFPYNKDIFKDRYTRLDRNKPCKTILAHLAKDGLMFIHPTQLRSLTVREAARIQTFPDWFEFPDARTHAFRLIGNAVPPIVGAAVGNVLFSLICPKKKRVHRTNNSFPKDKAQAIEYLSLALNKNNDFRVQHMDNSLFLKVWNACFYLMPGLHPDEALDHGTEIAEAVEINDNSVAYKLSKYYVRSGWPVALGPLVAEAWKRFDQQRISKEQFYSVEAVKEGIVCLKRGPQVQEGRR